MEDMDANQQADAGMASNPPRFARARRVALLNQKGGVGKTTTTCNLGAALSEAGCRVLLLDLDPQGHLSLHLGVDGETSGATAYDLFTDPEATVADAMIKVRPNLSLVPAVVDLAAAESELADMPNRNEIIRRRFEPVLKDFDCFLIDCPPSLGLLTLNALAATDEVMVPMQAHFLALQGVGKLLETVGLVSQGVNDKLKVSGIVLCNHETQSTHGKEVVEELDAFFAGERGSGRPWQDAQVFRPAIRRNIKLAEAPSFGQTIFDYAPWCPGALDYRKLAERLLARWVSESSAPTQSAAEPKPFQSQAPSPTESVSEDEASAVDQPVGEPESD